MYFVILYFTFLQFHVFLNVKSWFNVTHVSLLRKFQFCKTYIEP